jgi:hypothetical protein
MRHEIKSLSKRDAETSSVPPNDPATLLGPTEQQFKSIRQLDLDPYFEARAAGGIIDNPALNDRIFRTNDQFGQIRMFASRTNAGKAPRIHHAPLSMTKPQRINSQSILKTSLNFMVMRTLNGGVIPLMPQSRQRGA